MGPDETLDIVARDRRSLSVVQLASTAPTREWMRLEGGALYQPERGYGEPLSVPISVVINTQDAAGFATDFVDGSLRLRGPNGVTVGPEIVDYQVATALSGKYEIHSALVIEDGQEVDVFAISDIVQFVIGGVVLAACLAIYAAEFALIKKTLDAYKAAGLVPKWHIRGSFGGAVTCRFDVEMEGQDPYGNVVKKDKVRVGRKNKKK